MKHQLNIYIKRVAELETRVEELTIRAEVHELASKSHIIMVSDTRKGIGQELMRAKGDTLGLTWENDHIPHVHRYCKTHNTSISVNYMQVC